ncbi:MAG TPA: hypothetical protein VNX25_06510 [Verrucomicrobiae bacterium]|nr:hypothetical protein [Verrucomicrobiae bacterium]
MKGLFRSTLVVAFAAVAMFGSYQGGNFGPSAAEASSKLIYQSPPEGITLTADAPTQTVKTLLVGSYNAVRITTFVRASSSGTGKVGVELWHADPYLSPYTASPLLEMLLGSTKDISRGTTSSTIIERPGVKVNLKLVNRAPAAGESYVVDLFVYGGS